MRIALFVTCLGDALFPDVGRATVAVLERLGHEVVFPPAQTCCGQMHTNTGYQRDGAAAGAPPRRRLRAGLRRLDAIVAPSGSCVGSVRHQHAMVARRAGDEALAARRRVGRRAHLRAVRAARRRARGHRRRAPYYPHRVTYHPTCHSLRLLRVGDKPLRLLRAVRGIDLVELPDAEQCCGFGGTFARQERRHLGRDARRQDAPRARHRAEVVTAGDASCLMHIGGGLSRLRSRACGPCTWPRSWRDRATA